MDRKGNKFFYSILEYPDKKIFQISSGDYEILIKLFYDLENNLERELEGELTKDFPFSTLSVELKGNGEDKKILDFIGSFIKR